jgi:hypothetical protein
MVIDRTPSSTWLKSSGWYFANLSRFRRRLALWWVFLAEEQWLGFRQPVSIPAPPSIVAGVLQHLHPPPAQFLNKSSMALGFFDAATATDT